MDKKNTILLLGLILIFVLAKNIIGVNDNPIQDDIFEQEMLQENKEFLEMGVQREKGWSTRPPQTHEFFCANLLYPGLLVPQEGDTLIVKKLYDDSIILESFITHSCIDSLHITCDGECECDGYLCGFL